MQSNNKTQNWEALAGADDGLELDNDFDFLTPVASPNEPVPLSPGDFDSGSFEETYIGELARGGDQPVPRIAIEVFCERPETAQLVQSASTDRRIAKASVTVNMGGLQGAIKFYETQPVPNLIIVESLAPVAAMLQQLDQLASHCDEGVKVIMIGEANDIALYRELIRRGVSEYLVPPLQPLQLIRSISQLYVDVNQPFMGQSIAFVGAKGGVGSSTIAHNVAWSLAERALVNTTLVDLDLSFGTTGLDFNTDAASSVVDALEAPERVDDVLLDRLLTRHTDRLTLFTAPSSIDKEFEIDTDAYEVVIDGVRRGVPFVVLDLPHTWNRWMRQTLLRADQVVLVCEPDLAGLRNAKNIFDMLKTSRPNDAPPRIILNKVGVPKRPEIPVKDFAAAMGTEPLLVLPYEPALFGTAANNGQMISDVSANSKCAEGIDFLAQSIIGRVQAPTSKPSLLSKLKSIKLGK